MSEDLSPGYQVGPISPAICRFVPNVFGGCVFELNCMRRVNSDMSAAVGC
jgi:hypothetical protein